MVEQIWLLMTNTPVHPQYKHIDPLSIFYGILHRTFPCLMPKSPVTVLLTFPHKVYCNMDDDGGGWTLVWKHSAMEVGNLTEDMKYFSEYYKACTDLEVGWCNIPYKARFDPTEMMIAAYHNKRLVFAYKGVFNWNIEKDWTGGYLANYVRVQDNCARRNGVPPMPNTYSSAEDMLGLVFAKRGTYMNHTEHYTNDYYGSMSNPGDCRWWDCQLPWYFRSPSQYTQMTTAIFVR